MRFRILDSDHAWLIESIDPPHSPNIDPEIRAARPLSGREVAARAGPSPTTPNPSATPPRTTPASEPTDWEDLGDAPGTSGAADARDVAEAVERAIEEREGADAAARCSALRWERASSGTRSSGATRSIGRALQRWGSGEHRGRSRAPVAGPPEERARRAQMRRDEALARRLQREARAAAGMRPDYDPPAGTGTGGDERAIRDGGETKRPDSTGRRAP